MGCCRLEMPVLLRLLRGTMLARARDALPSRAVGRFGPEPRPTRFFGVPRGPSRRGVRRAASSSCTGGIPVAEKLKNPDGTSTTDNTPQSKSGHHDSTGSTTITLEIAEEEEEEESEKAAEVPEVTETELKDAPHAEEQPPQETETPEGVPDAGSDKDESKDDDADKNATPTEAVAPASGGDGGLAASALTADDEAVKRVDGDLTDGGLLLTQVMGGNRKVVRRLELEEKKGVLKWEVDALFGMKWEKVKLSEARVMSNGSVVKIGVAGKSDFFSFKACDDLEAGAVCKALVTHAKKHKVHGSDDEGASEADK